MNREVAQLWSEAIGAEGTSWSNQTIELEERARRHAGYESWILLDLWGTARLAGLARPARPPLAQVLLMPACREGSAEWNGT